MKTDGVSRRALENGAMAGLMLASRVLLSQLRVREVLSIAERVADAAWWTIPATEHVDTLARGQALAYRWSMALPGCSCLHRAVSTHVWLAGFRIRSRIVLGMRKGAVLEGHAWLEVDIGDAATLLFIEDEGGYPIDVPLEA